MDDGFQAGSMVFHDPKSELFNFLYDKQPKQMRGKRFMPQTHLAVLDLDSESEVSGLVDRSPKQMKFEKNKLGLWEFLFGESKSVGGAHNRLFLLVSHFRTKSTSLSLV